MNHSKVALVLAGGGLTGAVYEIGALRAIDDLLVDRTVNDFDIYVGTSAGALVASFLVNGVSPEEMLSTFQETNPDFSPPRPWNILSFNNREFLKRVALLPGTLVSAWAHYVRHLDDMTMFDVLWSLMEALPSGMYDALAMERYVRQLLSTQRCTNDFDELEPEFYVIATDLDSGERVVFGPHQRENVPISEAVTASSALPLVYNPVRVGENDCVDGGLRGPASLDLAVERGANLIICINPLVPYDNRDRDSIPFLGPDGGHLSRKGARFIASQVMRIVMHSSLQYHVKQLRRQHPDVDIILIEPRRDDYQMFFYNIMRYSARLTVARHGFESITLDLAEDYHRYRRILARHGIPLSRRLVISELNEIQESGYDPKVIQKVLQTRQPRCNRRDRNTPICQLTRTLAELDLVLDQAERD